MSNADALWKRVYDAFKWHQQPPRDPTPQAALNRIAAKCIRLSFDPSNCVVHEQFLSIDGLRQLKTYHNKDRPKRNGGSIVVLVHGGQKLVIDGNKRVNKWLNEASTERRSALIIEPKSPAS